MLPTLTGVILLAFLQTQPASTAFKQFSDKPRHTPVR